MFDLLLSNLADNAHALRQQAEEREKNESQRASSGLRLEGEAGTDLVGGLVELLGVEGGAQAQGDAGAEEDVVGNGGDTAVVDLALLFLTSIISARAQSYF